VGIRHLVQGEPDPRWLARPDVRRGLRAVAGAGLVYDLLTLPHQLPAAIDTVRALPDLTFVLDHLSKPPIAAGELHPWAALVRELAALPNVSCKRSGMVTEAGPRWTVAGLRPYAEVVLDAFSPARVMFGSDWPVCLLAASYADVTLRRAGADRGAHARGAGPGLRRHRRSWSTACQMPGHENPHDPRGDPVQPRPCPARLAWQACRLRRTLETEGRDGQLARACRRSYAICRAVAVPVGLPRLPACADELSERATH